MKKSILLLLLLFASSLSASVPSPEFLYSGYAAAAGVDDINAVFNNPAALTSIKSYDIYITLSTPLVFRTLALPIPITEEYTAGLGLDDDGILQRIRLGLPVVDAKHFKAGVSLGLDRELPRTLDNSGFALDLGLLIPFFQDDKRNFGITWGTTVQNLLGINDFQLVKRETYPEITSGIRMELFVKDLFLNLGGNYRLDKLDLSSGLEKLISKSVELGICLKGDELGIGTAIHMENSALTFAWNIIPNRADLWTVGYNFYFNPRTSAAKKIQLPIGKNGTSAGQLQRKQKVLLDKGIELYKAQEYEQARTNWNQCIQLGPNSATALEAKKYLDRVNTILNNLK